MANQIMIFYKYSKLDKAHCYGIVCNNFWIWYWMGEQFTKKEKASFRLFPYAIWEGKIIKIYKSYNSGHLVVPAIRKHFNSLKK